MANYIKPPLLDKTGKEIVAALTGEAVQPSASKINAPISDETGKAILEAIQQGGGGGGANVLTLYVGNITASSSAKAFKDRDRTERYESFDEAANAVSGASSIKVMVAVGTPTAYFANSYTINTSPVPALPKSVTAGIVMGDGVSTVELFNDEDEPT